MFQPLEYTLKGKLSPDILQGAETQFPGREVTQLHVKHVGLALPYRNMSVPENWMSSCVVTDHLVAALQGWTDLLPGDHTLIFNNIRENIKLQNILTYYQALAEGREKLLEPNLRRLQRRTKTGAWISVQPYMINGKKLGDQEWRDTLLI